METKMKGLLKGLRYISQIFEGEDKEPEMQIGFPTDVKHVAHIGWDGPSTTAPSWMNEYRSTPLSASSVGGETAPTAEFKPTGAGADSTSGGGPPRPRTSRRKDSSTSSNPDSPGRGDSTKPSRRRPSTGAVPVDSLPRESTTDQGSRRGRRNHSSSEGSGSAGPGLDSQPSQHADHPVAVPKQSRRRKTKESSSSGGSSRSRNRASDSTHGSAPAQLMPLPSMPEREEDEGF